MSVRGMRMDDKGDEERAEIGPEMVLGAMSGNLYELEQSGKAEQRENHKSRYLVDAENRLREYASGRRAGGGQQLADAAIVAGYSIYQAGIRFRDWAQGVVSMVGNEVRPFLRSTWRLLQAEAHGR